jgi:hypothetical protein
MITGVIGNRLPIHTLPSTSGDRPMNRETAFRACIPFVVLSALAAITGLSAQAELAEAIFLIGASVSAVVLMSGLTAPVYRPIPIKARRLR